jgi:PqqD family protein of HPr-rel-A system
LGGVTEVDWGVPRSHLLLWAAWESDYSVFDGGTGETHLLSELPAEMLRQLSKRPMSWPRLSATLAQLCEVEETRDWARKVADILRDLADLELVEPIAP